MLREEARVWSIKFPVAPEFTNAVDTVHEGQSNKLCKKRNVLSLSTVFIFRKRNV